MLTEIFLILFILYKNWKTSDNKQQFTCDIIFGMFYLKNFSSFYWLVISNNLLKIKIFYELFLTG